MSESSAAVTVRIRYLSAIREKTGGKRQDEVSLPCGSTLASVAEWLQKNYGLTVPGPALMSTLNGLGWNQVSGGMATELNEADEVAIFPLLSGG
jgi:molybdopterin converting factor small subunit